MNQLSCSDQEHQECSDGVCPGMSATRQQGWLGYVRQSFLGGPSERGGVATGSTMVGVGEIQIILQPKSSVYGLVVLDNVLL